MTLYTIVFTTISRNKSLLLPTLYSAYNTYPTSVNRQSISLIKTTENN